MTGILKLLGNDICMCVHVYRAVFSCIPYEKSSMSFPPMIMENWRWVVGKKGLFLEVHSENQLEWVTRNNI